MSTGRYEGERPARRPAGWTSLTGVAFAVDDRLAADRSREMLALRSLEKQGLVALAVTELAEGEGPEGEGERRGRLVTFSGQVLEEPADEAGDQADRFNPERVFGLLFPARSMATAGARELRDAVKVSTSMRYGATGFLTTDRTLFEMAWAIETAFGGFLVRAPARGLMVAQQAVAAHQAGGGGG